VLGILCGGQTWTRVSGPIPSSPSNLPTDPAAKGGTAKGAAPKTAPHAKSASKAPPKTTGQKGTTEAADADPVGDICLIPDIARTPH
jgi:hypothetical protein